MFKLVVLSCLVSVAFAGIVSQPIHYAQVKSVVEPHYSVVETPTISHVGSVVKSIPTAHSYQSQTQYHSKSVVEPIYAHGVEKSYISTPVVKSVVEHVPVAKAAYVQAPVAYHSAPVAYQAAPVAYHSAPVAYQSVYAPKALSYSAYPAVAQYVAYPAAKYAAAYPSVYSAYPSAEYAHHY
jgi:Drosophila Retinin like protein